MKPRCFLVLAFVSLALAKPGESQTKQKLNHTAASKDVKADDEFLKTIQTVKRSVTAVACGQRESDGSVSLVSMEGTGFFVSEDGTFLTAGHVAHGLYLGSPPREKLCIIPVIYVPTDGWKVGTEIQLQWFKIENCVYNDDLDLAKCKTVQNPFKSDIKVKPLVVDFETSTQLEGTPVAFTGFPLNTAQPITARATVGAYWGAAKESNPREMVIDHSNWPGASGAPVYLSNGKVVGLILKRGFNEASGLAFARSAAFIKSFMAEQNTASK